MESDGGGWGAGAVNENENQQGLAHVVEHVTFLGSKKRERLLGTGARSNAYTDFHHTVFHIHSPLHNAGTKESLMPQVTAQGLATLQHCHRLCLDLISAVQLQTLLTHSRAIFTWNIAGGIRKICLAAP